MSNGDVQTMLSCRRCEYSLQCDATLIKRQLCHVRQSHTGLDAKQEIIINVVVTEIRFIYFDKLKVTK